MKSFRGFSQFIGCDPLVSLAAIFSNVPDARLFGIVYICLSFDTVFDTFYHVRFLSRTISTRNDTLCISCIPPPFCPKEPLDGICHSSNTLYPPTKSELT